jgi:cytochrome c-type biogenesis protein CcmH
MLLCLLLMALPAAAQEAITDDQVNAIAGRLYCPVCENIPLEVCGTPACIQWRAEIRDQLAQGRSEAEIVDDFVQRFGDRVVGTPQDPMLRALSLATPWVIGLLAALVAVWTLLRWRRGSSSVAAQPEPEVGSRDDDYYRSRIEADLATRR